MTENGVTKKIIEKEVRNPDGSTSKIYEEEIIENRVHPVCGNIDSKFSRDEFFKNKVMSGPGHKT